MTQDDVKSIFDYFDGHLYWKKKVSQKVNIGQRAGTIGKDGRISITVNKQRYREHQLVFLYHHGYIPELIDHINCDKSDNHIENLRPATTRQNGLNRTKQINNTSGYKGVYWHKHANKWAAYCDGKNLGYFKNKEEANLVVTQYRENTHLEFAKH